MVGVTVVGGGCSDGVIADIGKIVLFFYRRVNVIVVAVFIVVVGGGDGFIVVGIGKTVALRYRRVNVIVVVVVAVRSGIGVVVVGDC